MTGQSHYEKRKMRLKALTSRNKWKFIFLGFIGIATLTCLWSLNRPKKQDHQEDPTVYYYQHLENQRWHQYLMNLKGKKPQPVDNIIFMETSGRGTLTFRQLVSIESAAIHIAHHKILVYVLTDNEVIFTPAMRALQSEYKVTFQRTTLEEITKHTMLEEWYKRGTWNSGWNTKFYLSDAIRYLTIYTYGGVYMDLDFIVTRNWIGHVDKNIVVREHPKGLGSEFHVFDKGHPVHLECLKRTISETNTGEFGVIGPSLFTRKVMERFKVSDDVLILPNHTFYEISYNSGDYLKLFQEGYVEEVMRRTKQSYAVHLWNKFSGSILVRKNSTCAYMILLKKNAPLVYRSIMSSDVMYV